MNVVLDKMPSYDEADTGVTDDGLVYEHVLRGVAQDGERGIGDGAEVRIATDPDVVVTEYTMVCPRRP